MNRITVDLDDKISTALNRWVSKTAAEIGPPYPEVSEIVAAMIVVSLRYTDVADTVTSQIRHQRAAVNEGRERGRG